MENDCQQLISQLKEMVSLARWVLLEKMIEHLRIHGSPGALEIFLKEEIQFAREYATTHSR